MQLMQPMEPSLSERSLDLPSKTLSADTDFGCWFDSLESCPEQVGPIQFHIVLILCSRSMPRISPTLPAHFQATLLGCRSASRTLSKAE